MGAVTSVTLNRIACVLPPDPFDSAPAQTRESAIAATLVAEIAERLEELNGIREGYAARLINHLSCIASNSERSFDITVQLLHCNYDEVLASYQDQAEKRAKTKQDIHWEFTTEVAKLKRLYPLLYQVIIATRAQAMRHEDPVSKSETLGRAGTPGSCEAE